LLRSEHVHHRNHDTLDNHPDNLILLSHGEHIREHLALQQGQWSLHYTECQECHSTQRRHFSKGFCTACYQRLDRLAHPERFRAYDKAKRRKRLLPET
jgi:hypothetical protein